MTAIARFALRSLGRRPLTAVLLATSLGIAFGLPGAIRAVVSAFEQDLTARADAAPLVLGSSGSRSDLVLHALYFQNEPPGEIRLSDKKSLDRENLAETVPLCVRATVRGLPVVGTDGGYFKLRKLSLGSGRPITRLADCVLGSEAADRLGLLTGGTVATDPKNLFGASGGVPVRLRITGVLAPTGTADDSAAFVSLDTAWLVAGLGHAHASRAGGHVHPEGAEPVPSGFIEVTDENVKRFHFHGNKDRFPLTAVIAVPKDNEARLLLFARYAVRDDGPALVESDRVLQDILGTAVRVRRLFDANAAVTATATILLSVAVVALTLRLRGSEVHTMHRLGLSRSRIAALFGTEFGVIAAGAALLAVAIAVAARSAAPALLEWFVR